MSSDGKSNSSSGERPRSGNPGDGPVLGPEDPRYFDLRYFPEPGPGQNGVEARLAQVAVIKARQADSGTVAYQIKARHAALTGTCDSTFDDGDAAPYKLIVAFPRLVPKKPYCADDLNDGLMIRSRQTALTKKHIQLNPPGLARWIVHDLDYATGGAYAYRDVGLPLPNVLVINRANGHAHGLILLKSPVATHSGGRAAPLAFLAAVERGMTRRLDADRGYAGLVAKNPLHRSWGVEWLRDRPFTLHELDDSLFSTDKRPYASADSTFGFGRNCICFDGVRASAYREVLAAKRAGKSVGEFQAWLENVAQAINCKFSQPLPPGEIRGIAKSVANWTWRTFSPERLSERHSKLGKRGAEKRWAGHVSAERQKPWQVEGTSRRTYYRRRQKARKEGKKLPRSP